MKCSFMFFWARAVVTREQSRPPLTKNKLLMFGRYLSFCVGAAIKTIELASAVTGIRKLEAKV